MEEIVRKKLEELLAESEGFTIQGSIFANYSFQYWEYSEPDWYYQVYRVQSGRTSYPCRLYSENFKTYTSHGREIFIPRVKPTDSNAIFSIVGAHQVKNQVFTQIPLEILERFDKIIDLSDVLESSLDLNPPRVFTVDMFNSRLIDKRYISEHSVRSSRQASISFLSEEVEESIKLQLGDERIRVLSIYQMDRVSPFYSVLDTKDSTQILKGSAFFPYSHKIVYLDPQTEEVKTGIWIGLGILDTAGSFDSNPRKRKFLASLLKKIESTDLSLISGDLALIAEKRFKESLSKYWTRFPKCITDFSETSVSASEFDFIEKAIKEESLLNNSQLSDLVRGQVDISGSKIGRAYNRALTVKAKREEEASVLDVQVERSQNGLGYKESKLQNLERRLEDVKNSIEEAKIELHIQEEKINDYMDKKRSADAAVERSNQAVEELLGPYKEECERVYKQQKEDDHSNIDWFENFKASGIIINDIKYKDADGVISVHSGQTPTPGTKHYLYQINFMTLKPTKIHVDNGDVRVGGPYEVLITKRNMSDYSAKVEIRAATLNSIVGLSRQRGRVSVCVHPHQGSQVIDTDLAGYSRAISEWFHVCAGELHPILKQAFNKNDPRTAIYGVLGWLGTAVSSDEYGRKYTWFPKVDRISLDGQAKEELKPIDPGWHCFEIPLRSSVKTWQIRISHNTLYYRESKRSKIVESYQVYGNQAAALSSFKRKIATKVRKGWTSIGIISVPEPNRDQLPDAINSLVALSNEASLEPQVIIPKRDETTLEVEPTVTASPPLKPVETAPEYTPYS